MHLVGTSRSRSALEWGTLPVFGTHNFVDAVLPGGRLAPNVNLESPANLRGMLEGHLIYKKPHTSTD
jgi:hypothetical protein